MTNDNALKMVHLLKFSRYRALATPMGRVMAAARHRFCPNAHRRQVVIPVPMARQDRRARGFDQSLLLAITIAGAMDLPVLGDVLCKPVRTVRQSVTPHSGRASNVKGAFVARSSSELEGASVLLVDDLVTSGATAGSCAAELLAAGAGSIEVVCFARAL